MHTAHGGPGTAGAVELEERLCRGFPGVHRDLVRMALQAAQGNEMVAAQSLRGMAAQGVAVPCVQQSYHQQYHPQAGPQPTQQYPTYQQQYQPYPFQVQQQQRCDPQPSPYQFHQAHQPPYRPYQQQQHPQQQHHQYGHRRQQQHMNQQQHRDPQRTRAVEQFVDIAGCSTQDATAMLKLQGWSLSEALRAFYASQSQETKPEPAPEIVELFHKYKAVGVGAGGDETLESIHGEGVVAFMEDLGIDPYTDTAALTVVWRLGCKEPYAIGYGEFTEGLCRLKCSSLQDIKDSLQQWATEAEEDWQGFYEFCFVWSRPTKQMHMDCDGALELWSKLLTGSHAWQRLGDWGEFIKSRKIKSISRDVWGQMRTFALHADDFSDYDMDNGAWPCVFDEFVAHLHTQQGHG